MQPHSKNLLVALVLSIIAMLAVGCGQKLDCTREAYAEAKDDAQRSKVLEYWLKHPEEPSCPFFFRTQINEVDPSTLPLFRRAFLPNADCKALTGIAHEFAMSAGIALDEKDLQKAIQASKTDATPSLEDLRAIKAVSEDMVRKVAPFKIMFERLGEEFRSVVRRERVCIVTRAISYGQDGSLEDMLTQRAFVQFLVSAGEDGLEMALTIDPINGSKEERATYLDFITSMLSSFDGQAVIPLLKKYERGEGDGEGIARLILRLPDTPGVFQKIIEASQHGRYIDIPTPRSAEEFEKAVRTAWNTVLEVKYKNNIEFARYLGRNMPKDARPGLIDLFLKADLGTALTHLLSQTTPSINEIKSLRSLLAEKTGSPTERESIFEFVYKHALHGPAIEALDDTEVEKKIASREYLLLALNSVRPEFGSAFVRKHFAELSTKERMVAMYGIKDFPSPLREETFDAIRPLCSELEQAIITEVLRTKS